MEVVHVESVMTEPTSTAKLTTHGKLYIKVVNAIIYYHVPNSFAMVYMDDEKTNTLYEAISYHIQSTSIKMPKGVLTFINGINRNDRSLPETYALANLTFEFDIREHKQIYNFRKWKVIECNGRKITLHPFFCIN